MRRFRKNTEGIPKTATIEKRNKKGRHLRQSYNFYQRSLRCLSESSCHVLNFYNVLAINESSIRNPNHDESFIRTHFYFKNMKKIEVTDKYLVVFLEDHRSLICPVQQIIQRFSDDQDIRLRNLSSLLKEV